MKLSDKGKEFIQHYEGYREEVYADAAGLATIGWGHLLLRSESYTHIDKTQALILFNRDASVAESVVNTLVKCTLSQNEFDALVDFVFNLGGKAFLYSTLLKKLNNNDKAGAAEQLLRWNKVKDRKTGEMKPVTGLSKRRFAERQTFLGTSEAYVLI